MATTIEEDLKRVCSHLYASPTSNAREAFARIRAALTDLAHLEEGARLLRSGRQIPMLRSYDRDQALWLEAESKRQARKEAE